MAKFQKGQSGNPAGRPRKADTHAGAIAKAEARIAKNLSRYIANMEALADGVYVEETDDQGKRIIYQRPPDRAANQFLIEQIMGKATQRQEITGGDGDALAVKVYVRSDDFDPDDI